MTTPTDLAHWLARHADAIACDEAAGEIYADVKTAVDAIERVINRPESSRYCGPCPTLLEDQNQCRAGLFAKRDAVEIRCWKCKMTHNVEQLIGSALRSVGGLLYSAGEVQELMSQIGQPIPSRTWRYWRASGRIEARGWRGAEPMYWISDVQDLLAAKPQKVATGSAAEARISVD